MTDDVRAALKEIVEAKARWVSAGSYSGGETYAAFAARLQGIAKAALEKHPSEPIRSPEVWDKMEQSNLDRDEPKEQLRVARERIAAMESEITELAKERDDAVEALDANWVSHGELVRARERIADLEKELEPFRPMSIEQAEAELAQREADLDAEKSPFDVEHGVKYATDPEYRAEYLRERYVQQFQISRGFHARIAELKQQLAASNAEIERLKQRAERAESAEATRDQLRSEISDIYSGSGD